jgi:hypothetical protein
VIGLCDRWQKTPDEILACDSATLLRYLNLMEYSRGNESGEDGAGGVAGPFAG